MNEEVQTGRNPIANIADIADIANIADIADIENPFETRARGLGIQRVDYSICVKDKKSDPPDFPAGRIFSVNSEDEWEIFRGFVFADPKQFELVGECFVLSDWSSESCFYLTRLEYF